MEYLRYSKINWLYIIAGVNVAIFVIMFFLAGSFESNQDYAVFGALHTSYVIRGYYWLMLTSAFIHFNPFHFLFNIYSLMSVGRTIDEFYSDRVILIVYIFSALGGSLLTVFISLLLATPSISIGASGGIFGLAGFILAATVKRQRFGAALPINPQDVLFPILVSFLIGFIPGLGVNNWAHLGGFIAGFLLGLYLKNSIGDYKSGFYKRMEDILFYLSVLIFIGSFIMLCFNIYKIIFI